MEAATPRRPNAYLSLVVWLLPASRAKNRILRWLGHRVDPSAVIGPNLVVGCGYFDIGDGAVVDPFNLFRNLSAVSLGSRVRIGRYNQISAAPQYQLLSDKVGRFIMRDISLLTNRHYVDCSGQVLIGYHAAVGGIRTIMQSHEYDLLQAQTTVGKVVVGEYSMTGGSCLLLKDAHVPPYSVLAAGTVMAKRRDDDDARPGLYGGVPARFLRALPDLAWYRDDVVVRPVAAFDDSMFRLDGS